MLLQKRGSVSVAARKERRQGGGGFGGGGSSGTDTENSKLASREQPSNSPDERTVSRVVADGIGPRSSAPSVSQRVAATQDSPPTSLPAVTRDQVLATCAQTSALIAVMGFGLHQLAPLVSPAAYDGNGDALNTLLQCEPPYLK